MIRIILADDQVILRDSLKFIIEQNQEINVVATVNNGDEAYQACLKFSPDIVLMDIMMPICNGIRATQLIKESMPKIKILILTTFDDDGNVSLALKNGADGYILKDIKPDELLMAIKNVYNGLVVMDKNSFSKVVKTPISQIQDSPLDPKTSISLTEREIGIVKLIVDGKNNKEISQELFLSEGTIKNIVTTILEKFQFRDRTQLAVFAVKNRLV